MASHPREPSQGSSCAGSAPPLPHTSFLPVSLDPGFKPPLFFHTWHSRLRPSAPAVTAAWVHSCLPFSSCRSLLKRPHAASLACPRPDPSTLSPPLSYTCRHILSAPWGLRVAGISVLSPAVSQSAASACTGLFVAGPWSLSQWTTRVFSGLGRWVKWRLGAVVTFLLGPLTHRKLSLFCCPPGLGLRKAGVWQRN